MTFRLRKIISVLMIAAVLILAGTAAPAAKVLLGDVDKDGEVTIIDATCIQRYLAGLPVSGGVSKAAADVDSSGEIEITDATYIQRWLADLERIFPIGSPVDEPTQPTEPQTQPTEPPTQPTDPPNQPTEPPTQPTDPPNQPTDPPTQRPTDEEGWGRDVYQP